MKDLVFGDMIASAAANGLPNLRTIVWQPAWSAGKRHWSKREIRDYLCDLVAALEPVTAYIRMGFGKAFVMTGDGDGDRFGSYDEPVELAEDEWKRLVLDN